MQLHDYLEPVYVISVAAELLDVHPQTLRMYERKGLINPKRTDASQRLYSRQDLDDVKEIRRLTRDEGVNLAGVQIIIAMRHEIESLKAKIREIEHS